MLAETDLLKKIAKFCRATYLTASARMGTVRKAPQVQEQGSITARTGIDNSTNRAETVELETGTLYGRKRHDLGSKLARKHTKVGLENKQFWHENQVSPLRMGKILF